MSEKIEIQKIRDALAEALPGAISRLVEQEVDGKAMRSDYILEIQFFRMQFCLVIEVINQLGSSSARIRDKAGLVMESAGQMKGNVVPLIVARYISPRHQNHLRDMKVAFLDLSGNASLHYRSIHVDRRGFRNQFLEERSVQDPFSDKASLALRVLLGSDRSWGLRELAEQSQISPGYASKIMQRLEELGYVSKEKQGIHLRDARSLLDDWIDYLAKKSSIPAKERKYYCHAKSPREIMSRMAALGDPPAEVKYALSFHAGANLVDPHASFEVVDIYCHDLDAQVFFKKGLKLKPVDKGENVKFRRPRYKESAFFQARKIDGLHVVSDLQLYLDLYHYPIRGREQAEHLYRNKLRNLIER